jgi:hypothetical protein
MSKFRTCLFLSTLIVSFSSIAKADFDLQFDHSIDDGSTPDTFNAIGDANDPNVLVGYDPNDVLQPSAPSSGDYVQAYTDPNGVPVSQHITKDVQPLDLNMPDNTWLIKLIAHDDADVGLTGIAYFNLADPNVLSGLPSSALTIITRYDGNTPVQNYDLADVSNHAIQWLVINAQGHHGSIELKIIDECLAVSKLAGDPNFVNFQDYVAPADSWHKVGARAGDINGSNVTDMDDLALVVNYWLCDCYDL